MKITHLYTILLGTAFLSCSSETLTDAKLSDELLYVEKEIVLTAQQTERIVSVSADSHWEVEVDKANWADLSVDPMSGDGEGNITIRTNQNTTTAERTATLTITSTKGLKQKINIQQTLGDATLKVSTSELSFAESGGEQSFTVTSNTGWEILGLADWITVEKEGTGSNTIVKVTAEEIQDDRPRNLTLTIALIDGTVSHAIQVTQVGKTNITLDISPKEDIIFDATGGSLTIDVECNARWRASTTTNDWLTLSLSNGNSGSSIEDVGYSKITIECQPNYTTSSRGKIFFIIAAGSINIVDASLGIEQTAGTLPKYLRLQEDTLSMVPNTLTNSGVSLTFAYESMFPLTDHGICYSTTNAKPTTEDGTLSLGAGTTAATATATLANLATSTTYYARAYIISPMNNYKVVYSNVVTFTTMGNQPSPGDNPYPQLVPKKK